MQSTDETVANSESKITQGKESVDLVTLELAAIDKELVFIESQNESHLEARALL